MRRYKRIYVLLGVLALASAATFGVMQYEEKQEQIKNSDEIILELDSDSVQSLSWEYDTDAESQTGTSSDSETEEEAQSGSGTVALAFHRTDGQWLYDDDEAFPVDEEKIAALLENFEAFGVSFVIEEVEDYGQYGLDDPVCVIKLETEEDSWEISLGAYSSMDEERYVSIGDGNVYLVKNDPLDQFGITLSDMIKDDEIPTLTASAAEITQISFEGEQNYSITRKEDDDSAYTEDDVYFTELDGASLPLDTSLVSSYLSNISYLGLTDYVTYNVTEEELEQYGLAEPQLTVTVDYTYTEENEDGEAEEISNTFVLYVGRNPEELAAEAEAEESEEAAADGTQDTDAAGEEEISAYVRVGESQIVYQIDADDYDNLMAASVNDLRHQEVFAADFADAYQVDISLEGNVYSLYAQEDEDGTTTWYYQDNELEITNFRTTLNSLTATEFTDEEPSDKEEISLTVYLNNENYPKLLIELYRYNADTCLAMVDSKPLCLVERSGVVDLMEAVLGIVLK